MNINRNNYENYFLLYIDNELCPADKKAVEDFVHLHTDLKQELNMLQQTIVASEPVVFLQKESLFKIEEATQEKLLLHLDGELTGADAAIIEASIANNTALQKEWNLLQQTKLPQEKLVFEHKHDLLRKAPSRIVPIKWWRAAAAVFIGFGLVGTLVLVNNKNTDAIGNEVASKASNSGATTKPIQVAPVAAPVAGPATNPSTSTALQQTTPQKINQPPVGKNVNGNIEGKATAKENEPAIAANKKSTTHKRLENFNNDVRNETVSTNVMPVENISLPAATEPALTAPKMGLAKANIENVLKENNASYAVNTKNNITYDQLSPDDKRIRRSGLVRKVSRFFQRSTKKKADGDGLKIAGFEFAVR